MAFEPGWAISAFRDYAESPRHIALAVRCDNVIVGYLIAENRVDAADILRIAIHPDHKRHGYALGLTSALSQIARELSLDRLLLEVRADNAPAIGLYRSFGFTEDGRRPRYYRQSGAKAVDAVLFSFSL